MNSLNSQQLAFILDIKKEDARAKMVRAWEKSKGIPLKFDEVSTGKRNKKKKIEDPHPQFMTIELLATGLNVPTLQEMVNDIELNYLNRPASKKYILVDSPEKFIKKCDDAGKKFPVHIDIPAALKSLLPEHSIRKIYEYWKGFKSYDQTPRFILPD